MLEQMSDFFTARADIYDNHMLNCVKGCKEGYAEMAKLIPKDTKKLLDLGCGTGLELDEIFKRFPDLYVTGIDLTKAMLDKLSEKHPDKNLTLINASYFDYDFGNKSFDTAISFQTMHHFTHEAKIGLYKNIYDSLKSNGKYIECDYMVESQEDEDFYFNENQRLRKELNIPDGEFYHYDTPCIISNQVDMLKQAGFKNVRKVWHIECTTIVIAEKTD